MIQQARHDQAEQIVSQVVQDRGFDWRGFSAQLGRLTTHPGWGLLILAGVLYALYWFVGVFGAGMLVGLLEEKLFGQILNPLLTTWAENNIPFPLLVEFLFGPYGLWTMGMTYALALILPIVTTFFLAFGVMEDSGYLPRLAALSNRLFEKLGLNGKAVLPIVLGLGCVTMATLTTRVMESKRERFLVTFMLALAVPCSAQLGVVMGMLAGSVTWRCYDLGRGGSAGLGGCRVVGGAAGARGTYAAFSRAAPLALAAGFECPVENPGTPGMVCEGSRADVPGRHCIDVFVE